jgi:excinuclease UvrABC ATPase subunit
MDYIRIRGARTHNLKNFDLDLPRDKLIVFTGLSGSGKSSLAFDTIYAEGQRRYVESLSSYARQFLSMMEKPDVDHIEGLSPVDNGQRFAADDARGRPVLRHGMTPTIVSLLRPLCRMMTR